MAAVPVFHIKHCWVFVLVIFFVQRSHFYPLGRGGDYVVLPGLLNPLARPETQRWDRLPLYSVPWRGWGCSHQPWLLDSDPPNGNTAEPASVPSCCLCKATVGACVCGAVSHQLQSRPMSVLPLLTNQRCSGTRAGTPTRRPHVLLLPHSLSETCP